MVGDADQGSALVERVERLIKKGEGVLSTRRSPPPNVIGPDRVDRERFAEWQAQTMHLLTGLLGDQAAYVRQFAGVRGPSAGDVSLGIGVLRAVREDAEYGHLVDIRSLVAGEVFGDFLEMANHLLEQGYHVPAASLAGAVLEDGLQRVAAARNVEVKPLDGAGAIASKLVQAGDHSALEQRQLALAIEVRNNADHGRFELLDSDGVREMLRLVERYLAAHLTARP